MPRLLSGEFPSFCLSILVNKDQLEIGLDLIGPKVVHFSMLLSEIKRIFLFPQKFLVLTQCHATGKKKLPAITSLWK